MRIEKIIIDYWLGFRDIVIEPSSDAQLVTLVGENGTGKTSILDLISVALDDLMQEGARSSTANRPRLFEGAHRVSVCFRVDPTGLDLHSPHTVLPEQWDGLCTYVRRGDGRSGSAVSVAVAGSERPTTDERGWGYIVTLVPELRKFRYLYIGPSRVYSGIGSSPQIGPSPTTVEQWAAALVTNMAESYSKTVVAWEQSAIRAARERRQADPPPDEPRFAIEGLDTLLPHLEATGIDLHGQQSNIRFRTRHGDVLFSELSSGEKDLALLAIYDAHRRQIGASIVLFDEPELHLHPVAVRRRLNFLQEGLKPCQTWIATHSYEAVTVTGEDNTFALAFSSDWSSVSVTRWSGIGAARNLAVAMGYPSVPTGLTRIVFIEGGTPESKRRFERICSGIPITVVGGGNNQLVREHVRSLRNAAKGIPEFSNWRIGGVIDADYEPETSYSKVQQDPALHVLGCTHEENLFLNPATVAEIAKRRLPTYDAFDLLREASDKGAAKWIYHHVVVQVGKGIRVAEAPFKSLSWNQICADVGQWISVTSNAQRLDSEESAKFTAVLVDTVEAYRALRANDEELWHRCHGKSSLGRLASSLKMGMEEFTDACIDLWITETIPWPEPCQALRSWVRSISRA